MLKNMRNGVFSGLFLVLLVLGAAGLVLTDAGGFFSSGIKTSDVAKVGSHTINSRPFDNKVRRIIAMQGIEAESAFEMGIIHQALFREVRNLLMLQGANDLGIMVSDEQITASINEIIEPYMQQDTTSKKSDILAGLLRQSGLTESVFIDEVRTEMTNNILTSAIKNASMHVPELLIKDVSAFNEEIRDINYVVIDNSAAKLETPANEETLMRYYKSFQERYRTAEKRSFTVATLTKDKIKNDIVISDDEALALYEQQKESYTTPAQHDIAQAIAENEGDALKIIDAAKKGTPLSTAAKKVTGDDASFVETQSYTKGTLPKELDEDAFANGVKKGDILGPYETALGWHTLKIVDVTPENTPSFTEIKDTIKTEILEEEIWQTLDATIGELEDRIFSGEDPIIVAKDYKMDSVSYKNLTRNGVYEGSQDSPLKDLNSEDALNILKTANTLSQGETSSVIELSDSALGFVVMNSVEESVIKPYEDVKKTVEQQWTKEQKDSATFLKAKELSDKIDDGSLSWEDAVKTVKEKSISAKISRDPSFNDEKAEKDISTQARGLLLASDLGKSQILPVGDKTILALVKTSSLLNKKADKENAAPSKITQTSETQNVQQEAIALLYGSLQQKYKYHINEKLLTFLYNQPKQQ